MSRRVAFSLYKRVKVCTLLQNWVYAKSRQNILMGPNKKLIAPSLKNASSLQRYRLSINNEYFCICLFTVCISSDKSSCLCNFVMDHMKTFG